MLFGCQCGYAATRDGCIPAAQFSDCNGCWYTDLSAGAGNNFIYRAVALPPPLLLSPPPLIFSAGALLISVFHPGLVFCLSLCCHRQTCCPSQSGQSYCHCCRSHWRVRWMYRCCCLLHCRARWKGIRFVVVVVHSCKAAHVIGVFIVVDGVAVPVGEDNVVR